MAGGEPGAGLVDGEGGADAVLDIAYLDQDALVERIGAQRRGFGGSYADRAMANGSTASRPGPARERTGRYDDRQNRGMTANRSS
jgi:hypothetical protein